MRTMIMMMGIMIPTLSSFPDKNKDWCTVEESENERKIKIRCLANKSKLGYNKARQCRIRLKKGDNLFYIDVFQKGKKILFLISVSLEDANILILINKVLQACNV